MLTVFKEKIGEVRSPAKFFDTNRKAFDLTTEESKLILRVVENARIEGECLITPFGKGTITDMKTATKLALCLTNYPGFLFDTVGVSTKDLTKILVLPEGSLYLELKEPFQYLFQVNAKTASGVLLATSTDVNIWYFAGRNQW